MCHGLKVSSQSSAITMVVCAVTAFGSAGCRSGNPISRLVRVTPSPHAAHPDIEPPPQRLASASGVGDKASQTQLASQSSGDKVAEDASPHVRLRPDQTGDLTPRDAVPKNRTTTMASLDLPRDDVDLDSVRQVAAAMDTVDIESATDQPTTTERHFGDRSVDAQDAAANIAVKVAEVPAGRVDESASATVEATASSSPPPPKRAAAKLSASDYRRIMKAFENYPPEIRREAMQRLATALAPTAETSLQPKSPEDALRQRLGDLPELPNTTNRDPQRVAKRLGESAEGAAIAASGRSAEPSAENTPASDATAPASSRRQKLVQNAPEPGPAASEDPSPTTRMSVASDRSDQPAGLAVASHQPNSREAGVTTADADATPDPTMLRHAAVSNPPRSILDGGSKPVHAPEESDVGNAVASLGTPTMASPPMPQTASPAAADSNATESIATPTSVAPVSHVKPASSEELLAKVSDQELFATLVKTLSNPTPGETPAQKASRLIKLRHLKVLAGNPDAIEESLDGMSDSEQSFLRHQLQGLWTMVNPDGHPVPRRRLTHAIEEFRQATYHASAAADALEVRALNFCSELESYGQFTPFAGNRFKPKQEVILYCEVDNFAANKVADGYETNLQGTYDIYDQDGNQVAGQLLPPDRQVAVRIPRDRFVAYRMNLPADLPAGTYRLQLTMEDLAGKKYGQAEIPFQMAK